MARPSASRSPRWKIAGSFQGANIATFDGNPVTSVAAKATTELIEEENLLEKAQVVGNDFRSKPEELQQKHALIGKGGFYGNVLRLAPLLNTSKSDVDEAIRFLDKSLSEVRS